MRYNCFIAFFAAVIMLGTVGCTDNSPKSVAEKFLNSFYHKDYEDARQVSTETTIELINLMEQFSIQQPDSVTQNAKKIKIEILDVKEEGDKATVTYTASSLEGEQRLKMEKQNGKWLVSHSKQDDMDGELDDEDGLGDETADM